MKLILCIFLLLSQAAFATRVALQIEGGVALSSSTMSQSDLMVQVSFLEKEYKIFPYLGLGLSLGTVGGNIIGTYTTTSPFGTDPNIQRSLNTTYVNLATEVGAELQLTSFAFQFFSGYDFSLGGETSVTLADSSVVYAAVYTNSSATVNFFKLGVRALYEVNHLFDIGLGFIWFKASGRSNQSAPNAPTPLIVADYKASSNSLVTLGLVVRARFP